ncbi:bubble-like protein [Microdochium nivale]|nr:bubble-like protein [Microdochium nivale]
MKASIIFATILSSAVVAVSAAAMPNGADSSHEGGTVNLAARDVCGPGYGADQRRTNSPCNASNGDRRFCGCDRTGVVECRNGFWIEVVSCPGDRSTCSGGSQGGARC